jgi:hypothetical protein
MTQEAFRAFFVQALRACEKKSSNQAFFVAPLEKPCRNIPAYWTVSFP